MGPPSGAFRDGTLTLVFSYRHLCFRIATLTLVFSYRHLCFRVATLTLVFSHRHLCFRAATLAANTGSLAASLGGPLGLARQHCYIQGQNNIQYTHLGFPWGLPRGPFRVGTPTLVHTVSNETRLLLSNWFLYWDETGCPFKKLVSIKKVFFILGRGRVPIKKFVFYIGTRQDSY